MKRICIALAATLIALPAYAKKPVCIPFDKAGAPAGTKFTTLTQGQLHFVQGAYVAIPPAVGLPPGDGAVLVQFPALKGAGIAFTSMSGKMVCGTPMIVGADFIKFLLKVGTGPTDNDGLEL